MKRKHYLMCSKTSREIVTLKGTDVPSMNFSMFLIFSKIVEFIEHHKKDILSYEEIFEGFTFHKNERFIVISRLIKNKLLNRVKFNGNHFRYFILPNINWKKTSEMRVYIPEHKKEFFKLYGKIMT